MGSSGTGPGSPGDPSAADKAHLIAVQKKSSPANWFGWLPKKGNSSAPSTSVVRTHFSSTGGGGGGGVGSRKSKRVSNGTIAVTPSGGLATGAQLEAPQDAIELPQTPRKTNGNRGNGTGNGVAGLTTPARHMARALFASMGLTPERAAYGNLHSQPSHPPSLSSRGSNQGELELKNSDSQGAGTGHDTRLLRRTPTKSSHLTTIPGACGLQNIGNTCFMSVGLQCLSHTPLFRSYFLSGRYLDEINRDNPLGTGGKLVTEFATLLRMIWSGNNVHISPFKFKKALEKCKPIFAGHEQQDAQEFLSEMLDSLHEDVNRVIVKPYVKAPEDHVWDRLTLSQQAEDAWQRHLQRNRSVLVDLFQGQLMSEVTCQSCKRNSRTFDPFMLLSVPLPKHSEKQISVYLIRKMPHLPRQPVSAYTADPTAATSGFGYDPAAFTACLRYPPVPALVCSDL
jgi:hypothetical protein